MYEQGDRKGDHQWTTTNGPPPQQGDHKGRPYYGRAW